MYRAVGVIHQSQPLPSFSDQVREQLARTKKLACRLFILVSYTRGTSGVGTSDQWGHQRPVGSSATSGVKPEPVGSKNQWGQTLFFVARPAPRNDKPTNKKQGLTPTHDDPNPQADPNPLFVLDPKLVNARVVRHYWCEAAMYLLRVSTLRLRTALEM
jgi:hypothetical protein